MRNRRGHLPVQRQLIVALGNNENAMFAFYNRVKMTLPDTKLYEVSNSEQLIWTLDEAHSDDVVGNIDTIIIKIQPFTFASHKLIITYSHQRVVDYHLFDFYAQNWAGYTPDAAKIHRE